jgi:hypothetical protein
VGDVGGIAGEDPRVHRSPDPTHEQLPHGGAGLDVLRAGIEVGEGP